MFKFNFLDTHFKKYRVPKSEQDLIKILICVITPCTFVFVLYGMGYVVGILIAYFQKFI